jgi:hypothetical protein
MTQKKQIQQIDPKTGNAIGIVSEHTSLFTMQQQAPSQQQMSKAQAPRQKQMSRADEVMRAATASGAWMGGWGATVLFHMGVPVTGKAWMAATVCGAGSCLFGSLAALAFAEAVEKGDFGTRNPG